MAAISARKPSSISAQDVLAAGVESLRARLPGAWSLTAVREELFGDQRADAVLRLRAPDGGEVELLVDLKPTMAARDVSAARERLTRLVEQRPGSVGVIAARYLSTTIRARLEVAGHSYLDATGNMLIRSDVPGLFIADRGADNDPWRGPGRPTGSLKGEPAAKIVRTVVDLGGSWGMRELAEVAGVSIGSVYRVVGFLESEQLATRTENGKVEIPDWAAVLRRWGQDYQFLDTNTITRWIAPRGLPSVLDRIRTSGIEDYAVTGSVAAEAWAPYAPARSAMIYAADPERAAEAWGLRATDSGANVLLARPAFDVVCSRTVVALEGLRVATPTQVAVDLMNGPGRAPAEAEALLEWMEGNEQAWR